MDGIELETPWQSTSSVNVRLMDGFVLRWDHRGQKRDGIGKATLQEYMSLSAYGRYLWTQRNNRNSPIISDLLYWQSNQNLDWDALYNNITHHNQSHQYTMVVAVLILLLQMVAVTRVGLADTAGYLWQPEVGMKSNWGWVEWKDGEEGCVSMWACSINSMLPCLSKGPLWNPTLSLRDLDNYSIWSQRKKK